MDAGRKHENARLETKEFITHSDSGSQSVYIFLYHFP